MPYGIQQPALSSQILALEQDLGVKLFDRQPFRLTPEGGELYDFARPFFDNADKVAEQIRRRHAPKIRIASTELILRDYLPHVIHAVRRDQPELRFVLRSGNQVEIEAGLQAGEVDLGITTLDTRPAKGLKALPIVQLPLVLLAPRASPYRQARELWAQDPPAEPLISLRAEDSITRAFRRGLRALRVDWPTTIEASSAGLVTRYVANGYGIGVTLDIAELARHPEVKKIPLPDFPRVEIAALWRPPVSAAHQAVHAVIAARARELWPEKIRRN